MVVAESFPLREVAVVSDWNVIFRDAVAGVAGVAVYDKGHNDILGRYVIAKHMKCGNQNRMTQSNRSQRPAALRLAVKWLESRAVKAGTSYTPGDGARTMLYRPVPGQEGGAS